MCFGGDVFYSHHFGGLEYTGKRPDNRRAGAFGLYYVLYKNGSPYMHMQFFEPNLIIVRTNAQPNDMIFYRTADSLDTDSFNHLIEKEIN